MIHAIGEPQIQSPIFDCPGIYMTPPNKQERNASSMRKHRDNRSDEPGSNRKKPAIAIVGNMNVGKTTLFSRLCGREITSINIPGNTLAISSGPIKGIDMAVFDTPGICSIFSNNEDERISRDILLPRKNGYDVQGIILMADAKHMKRSIATAIQYAEYGLPMLLDVNMIDEAAPRGIKIDYSRLSEILCIDVFATIARDGIGIQKILSGLTDMRTPDRMIDYPAWIEQYLDLVAELLKSEDISPRAIGLLLIAGDNGIDEYITSKFGPGMLQQLKDLADEYREVEPSSCRTFLTNLYVKKAERIVKDIQTVNPSTKSPFITQFGDWCTQLSTGVPIAIAVTYIMYLFVGSFGATFLVDTINATIFEGFLIPWTTRLMNHIPNAFIRDAVVDPDFGVLPTGVFLALGLVTPVLFCFFIAFGILEDSGYLPRISILLDKLLKNIGLNGKGVIPLVMGFSCVTMAVLTTRMLDSEKERNIASFLLFLAMPCAPLLAVMLIILDDLPISATLTVYGMIFLQILIAGFLADKILPGMRTPLLMEIPAMRLPKLIQILKMALSKTYFFMKEALPVFIMASFAVFIFNRLGGLAMLEQIAGPFLGNLMGLPEKSIQVFIKTMIRREIGATELEHLGYMYTNLQLVVNLLVMTFIVPCINAVMVLLKERGMRVCLAIIGAVTVYAIVMGSVVNHTCRWLGITFT